MLLLFISIISHCEHYLQQYLFIQNRIMIYYYLESLIKIMYDKIWLNIHDDSLLCMMQYDTIHYINIMMYSFIHLC